MSSCTTRVKVLPADPEQRRLLLDEYFSSLLVADAEPDPDGGWRLTLSRPEEPEFFIDPQIEKGLAWWQPGTRPEHIASHVRDEGGWQLSLEDAWTAWAWSRRLARRPDLDEVLVLHVDDHTDCMSPHLSLNGDFMTDLITGAPVRVDDPDSVAAAIRSGAIGVAGFFAPFVHHGPRMHIRHLVARPTQQPRREIAASTLTDRVLAPGTNRPDVELRPSAGIQGVQSRYLATDDLEAWLADLPEVQAVWLHMDMDYFNNRFDGDSAWASASRGHDPDAEAVAARIDQVFAALRRSLIETDDVAVALSPGFFPAQFWPSAVKQLRSHIPCLLTGR